ncbi:unnamed protein product [Haemonchus placei]|uniref:Uncharacterized protein n=1 Tax=Haemonchus placei TaxID=6290 RepID=A0A0N4WYP4_HAEPC|nr:unnamed protein product [Haemonchus placei]
MIGLVSAGFVTEKAAFVCLGKMEEEGEGRRCEGAVRAHFLSNSEWLFGMLTSSRCFLYEADHYLFRCVNILELESSTWRNQNKGPKQMGLIGVVPLSLEIKQISAVNGENHTNETSSTVIRHNANSSAAIFAAKNLRLIKGRTVDPSR